MIIYINLSSIHDTCILLFMYRIRIYWNLDSVHNTVIRRGRCHLHFSLAVYIVTPVIASQMWLIRVLTYCTCAVHPDTSSVAWIVCSIAIRRLSSLKKHSMTSHKCTRSVIFITVSIRETRGDRAPVRPSETTTAAAVTNTTCVYCLIMIYHHGLTYRQDRTVECRSVTNKQTMHTN